MLSREDVLKIAGLARLELKDFEIDSYREQLSQILEYFKELDSLRLEGESGAWRGSDDREAFRDDAVRDFGGIEALLKNAECDESHHYTLPSVMDQS